MSEGSPHHQLAVHRRIGSLDIDADLALSAPWTILFGPSGSGKSSLLRAACGLLTHNGTRFERHLPNDELLNLTNTPAHQRNISWAPQQPSLFPHLNVRQNISFGQAVNPLKWDKATLENVIDLFKLEPFLHRFPSDLSGGERQRVSLARAFATPNCKLMLLDEPFTGIDHTLRNQLLPEMRAFLRDRNIPALSVTHDIEEALQLEAEVILLREGKVEAHGHVSAVLAPERDRMIRSLSRPQDQ